MTGGRGRVLRQLASAGVLPRVARWPPVLAGWLLSVTALLWKAGDVHDAVGKVTLLRIVAVVMATSVVALVDDDAANVLAPVPIPLSWRHGLRFSLAGAAVAMAWVAALLMVRPAHLAAALTLECAAMTAFALAVTSAIARWFDPLDASRAAGPAILGAAAVAFFLPSRWAVFAPPGDGWRDAHVRWTWVLGVALATLLLTLRDPARRIPFPSARSICLLRRSSSVRVIRTEKRGTWTHCLSGRVRAN